MRALYEAIAARLKPLKASDRINTIDLWNNQLEAMKSGKQKEIRMNAIYIAFQLVPPIKHLGLGIKGKTFNVRFYFALKNLKSDKRRDLDFYINFAKLMEGWASQTGEHPAHSAFREVEISFDEDHDNVALPFLDYQTQYIDTSGYKFGGENQEFTPSSPLDLTINKEIVDEL